MAFPNFHALTLQLTQHFQNKEFAEALALITREGPHFPEARGWADYWHMCAAARVGDTAQLYAVAAQALQAGLWYGETLWRQTPSFKPLQGDAAFERMVTAHLAAEKQAGPPPEALQIERPVAAAAAPLLVALHGNTNTAALTQPYWHAAVAQGWVLALPQSSLCIFKDAPVWDDLPRSEATVLKTFETLQTDPAIDPHRAVLAGHSMGGFVALQMALLGTVAVRGFVVNGPAVPFLDEPEKLDAALPAARERGLRGYFIVGTADDAINAAEIHALAAKLQAAGIACEVEMVPDATHDYTPAYDAALLRGLAFVMG